jgi:hypothetical protein
MATELMKDLVLSRYSSCAMVPSCCVFKHPCHHEPCRSAVTNPLATKLRAGMQERHSQATLATGDMPSKESVRTGHDLLMRWCTATATAPNAIAHPLFDAYVLHVSGQRHKAPTRYFLMLALDRPAERIRNHIVQKTLKSTYVGLQLDSWSSGGRHLTALCTSVPGEQFFASAYENWREDTAANSAVAVNACTQQLLGLSPTGSAAEALPVSKVAGVTSDTTNVMPATVRELARLPIFKGCIWVPCACHVLNSFLLDQVKQVEQIKELLVLAKGIVDVFRVQAFRRIFLRFTQSALSQLQLPVLVRFSSYAIMLQSLLKYRSELVSAVATEEFLTAANKATKRNKGFQPPLEQVHEVLLVAEEELERDELHSFDDRRAPAELTGRWKRVYQAVMSDAFWDAAEV